MDFIQITLKFPDVKMHGIIEDLNLFKTIKITKLLFVIILLCREYRLTLSECCVYFKVNLIINA